MVETVRDEQKLVSKGPETHSTCTKRSLTFRHKSECIFLKFTHQTHNLKRLHFFSRLSSTSGLSNDSEGGPPTFPFTRGSVHLHSELSVFDDTHKTPLFTVTGTEVGPCVWRVDPFVNDPVLTPRFPFFVPPLNSSFLTNKNEENIYTTSCFGATTSRPCVSKSSTLSQKEYPAADKTNRPRPWYDEQLMWLIVDPCFVVVQFVYCINPCCRRIKRTIRVHKW